MKHNFNFEFSPNLIILLGEQLIHDKKIALSELVKNAYDADASKVEVEVSNAQISYNRRWLWNGFIHYSKYMA